MPLHTSDTPKIRRIALPYPAHLAPREGLEPPTKSLEGSCSIRLSYRGSKPIRHTAVSLRKRGGAESRRPVRFPPSLWLNQARYCLNRAENLIFCPSIPRYERVNQTDSQTIRRGYTKIPAPPTKVYTVCLSVVGVEGFEPPTSCSQSRCATRLRHTPLLAEPGPATEVEG